MPMFANEEDIRAKLLMPFIENLGIDASEITLEKSFSIRLGKNKHIIRGRSDILCRKGGKNLFLIELKRDSLAISQQDIDQGISYARLLDNIVPFTIISNGKDTKIFDSITKKELTSTNISEQSDFWRHDCTLSTDEDLRIRYAALKNFISFSELNLKIFCETQVKDRMSPITGKIDDSKSKFVEELYVERQILHNVFIQFINSEASVFGMVGNAGVGKTNSMCSLALNSLDNNFVFFYNATLITKSPLHYIAQDLNLFFSGKTDTDIVLKKLNELGAFLNKTILIFIDAVDESTGTNFSHELGEIAYAIGKLDNIKICISCKLNIWGKFLRVNDTKTHLYEELKKSHNLSPDLDGNPGFFLKDFNDKEVADIIPMYQNLFGFKGQISESLKNELRNGFFLRIFSEVYSQKQIPEKINEIQLIKKYITQSLQKTNIGIQPGLRILSKIGNTLINQKFNERRSAYKEDSVEIDVLLEDLNLSLDKNLPEDLFARNILIKSYSDESLMVSFYYSHIRDYIICYHTYRLDKLSNQEFYSLLELFYINHIGQSAIDFYLENASYSHLNTFRKFKKDKALSYVVSYNFFLNKNFKSLKKEFDPKTESDIGIFLPKELIKRNDYALFPLKTSSEPRIQLENFDDLFSSNYHPLFQKGARLVYGSNSSLMSPNQSQLIEKNIFEQLRKIVKKGKLNEYVSDILLIEKVVTIVYFYYKKLGHDFKIEDYYLPRYNLIYPIDLKDLKGRIYKFIVKKYYENKYYKQLRVNRNFIKQKIANAIKMKIEIPKLNITGDFPPFEELNKIVDILLEKGYQQIEEKHYLPCPDKDLFEIKSFYEERRSIELNKRRNSQFTDKQAKLYIGQFFEKLEYVYKEIVEYNFPTLKNDFSFFITHPHEYFFYIREFDVHRWWFFGRRPSQSGKVEINFKNLITKDYKSERDGISIIHGFSFDKILHNDNSIQTVDRINSRKVDEFCVIRNWLYKVLNNDIEKLLEENI